MERVVFLTEPDERQVSCLLNPESVIIRRSAGLKIRSSVGGQVSGNGQTEYPLLYTGGGTTLIDLELLFDITLPESPKSISNVRQLTSEFFAMTESVRQTEFVNHLPTVRMIWGKSWNISAVVTDVAERLDYFTRNGVPQRSWLKMRLRKINNEPFEEEDDMYMAKRNHALTKAFLENPYSIHGLFLTDQNSDILQNTETLHSTDRLDNIADRFYHDPAMWKLLAVFNNIDNPLDNTNSRSIKIPALSELGKMA